MFNIVKRLLCKHVYTSWYIPKEAKHETHDRWVERFCVLCGKKEARGC